MVGGRSARSTSRDPTTTAASNHAVMREILGLCMSEATML
jgi:hypothetical protein